MVLVSHQASFTLSWTSGSIGAVDKLGCRPPPEHRENGIRQLPSIGEFNRLAGGEAEECRLTRITEDIRHFFADLCCLHPTLVDHDLVSMFEIELTLHQALRDLVVEAEP